MWEILHILSQTQWHSTVRLKVVLLSPDKPFTICKRVASCRGLQYGDSISLFCVHPIHVRPTAGHTKNKLLFLIWVCLGGLLHRPITGRPVNKNSTFKPGQTNECLNNEHRVFLSGICSYLSTREETWNYRLQ